LISAGTKGYFSSKPKKTMENSPIKRAIPMSACAAVIILFSYPARPADFCGETETAQGPVIGLAEEGRVVSHQEAGKGFASE
jgi:hypothetical protein